MRKLTHSIICTNFFLFFAITIQIAFASDIIYLKSGKQIRGEIIKQTDQYVEIDIDGTVVTLYSDSIDHIGGVSGSSTIPLMQRPAHIIPLTSEEAMTILEGRSTALDDIEHANSDDAMVADSGVLDDSADLSGELVVKPDEVSESGSGVESGQPEPEPDTGELGESTTEKINSEQKKMLAVYIASIKEKNRARDYDEFLVAVKKYAARDQLEQINSAPMRNLSAAFREKVFEVTRKQMFRVEDINVGRIDVSGNSGTIYYKLLKRPHVQGRVDMVKEHGVWKIRLDSHEAK